MNETPNTPEAAAGIPLPAALTDEAQDNQAALAKAIAELLPQIVVGVQAAFSAIPTPTGIKPGYKTTEFWLAVVMLALNFWSAISGLVKPDEALWVGLILTAIYQLLRTAVKTAPNPSVPQVPTGSGAIPGGGVGSTERPSNVLDFPLK